MQRHRQKDAEAGGEGLGNLATRKRLWKDSDGRVVNSSRVHKPATTSSSSTVAAKDQVENVVVDDLNYALMSPPTSTSSGGGLEQMENDPQTKFTYPEAPWKEMDMSFVPPSEVNDLDFWGDSSWANQPFQAVMGMPGDLPDNELTYPDTSTCRPSKFWMPFTDIHSNFVQCFTSNAAVLQLAVWERHCH